jgi:hypothetical protein
MLSLIPKLREGLASKGTPEFYVQPSGANFLLEA